MTTPHGRPTSRRWSLGRPAVAVGVLLLFLLTVLALVSRTGGTLVGDTTTNVRVTEVLPQMEPGDRVVQTVTTSNDRFASVQVTFGTYMGAADCELRVALHEDDGDPVTTTGALVAEDELDCSEVLDSTPMPVLEFAPRDVPVGTPFELVVERVDTADTPGVSIWAGEPDGDAYLASVNERPTDVSADVRPLYDPQPRWWDHLDVVTERMAAYGPAWGGPAGFAVVLLSVGVLVACATLATRRPTAFLVLVALLALARGLVWSAAVPAFGGMDEPAHFSNVQFMAEERALPGQADNPEIYSERLSAAQDVVNITSSAPGDRPDYTPEGEAEALEDVAAASPRGGGGGPAAAYPPPYYVIAAALYPLGGDSLFDQVSAARMASVLLGVAGAVLLVLLARRLFPERPGAQVAFALAGALHPMAAHQFAIVNNDAWVIVCGVGALLIGLELARRSRAPWLALLAGVVVGFALLGKPFGASVAVPMAVGWVIGKVRAREKGWRVLAGEAGLVALGFVATYGAWRAIAAVVDIPSQQVPAGTSARSVREFVDAQVGPGWQAAKRMWADQLWGNFGWVRIPFPEPVPTLIGLGLIALVLGLLAWLVVVVVEQVRRRRTADVDADVRVLVHARATSGDAPVDVAAAEAPHAADAPADAPAPAGAPAPRVLPGPLPLDVRIGVLASLVVAIVVVLYAAAWVYYASTGANDLLQGRYALLAMPAVLALPGLLLERFTRGRVSPLVANVLVAVAMGGLFLLGLKRTLEYFYG
ncbi:DUF2142 domain-containing protein [Cellulomonas sp. 179-A 9B4 NHS]|uniref:DUF2142 domain-containing protein n=1 Tax=Cellulomonas sp. 179-A 9B4 NHS TaxID=3142379 RepID=UPI0039A1B7DD